MTALHVPRGDFGCKAAGFAIAILLYGGILLAMAAFDAPKTGAFDTGSGGLTVMIGEAGGAAKVADTLSAASTEGAADGTAEENAPETAVEVTETQTAEALPAETVPIEPMVEAAATPVEPVNEPVAEPVTEAVPPEPVDTVEQVVPQDIVPDAAEPVATETVTAETVTAETVPEAPAPIPEFRPKPKPVAETKPTEPRPVKPVTPAPAKVAEAAKQAPPAAPANPDAQLADKATPEQRVKGGATASEAASTTRSNFGGTFAASDGSGGAMGAQQSYYASVQSWLERHKRYPRAAKLRRYEGVVQFRILIDRSGNILEKSIIQSSGRKVLDEAVLTMLKRADPVPPMPPEIPDKTKEFVTSIAFVLN